MTRYQIAGIGNAIGAGLIGWGLGWGIVQHHWIWVILIPAGILIAAPRHIMTHMRWRKARQEKVFIDTLAEIIERNKDNHA